MRRWLIGLAEGHSRRHGIYAMNRYINWRAKRNLEVDPNKWVAECADGTVRTLIEHLKVLQDYVKSDEFEGDGRETRRKHFFRIKGYYEANLVPLPDVRLKLPASNSHQVKVQTTATEFLKMLGKVLSAGRLSVRDRSVILVMVQSGMDASTLAGVFNFAGFPQLASFFGTSDFKTWNSERCPVRLDLIRPKSDYRFFSFVDVDGLEALKEWLGVRFSKYGPIRLFGTASPDDLPTSDPIYVDQYGGPLTAGGVGHIWLDSGKRAQINVHVGPNPGMFKGARIRYSWHSHEARDTIRTLARGRADVIVPEFLLAHDIDRLGYDKSPWDQPEYFRQEYLKIARPYLNPISGKAFEVRDELQRQFEERLTNLEKQMAERLGLRS